MVKRLVKMHFKKEALPEFHALFAATCLKIRAFPGCEHLELLQQHERPEILFTLSYWKDPADLEKYRQSELFKDTWAKTKVLFDGRPEAWTMEVHTDVSALNSHAALIHPS